MTEVHFSGFNLGEFPMYIQTEL